MRKLILAWQKKGTPFIHYYYRRSESKKHGDSTTRIENASVLSKDEADEYRSHWLTHPDLVVCVEQWDILAKEA